MAAPRTTLLMMTSKNSRATTWLATSRNGRLQQNRCMSMPPSHCMDYLLSESFSIGSSAHGMLSMAMLHDLLAANTCKVSACIKPPRSRAMLLSNNCKLPGLAFQGLMSRGALSGPWLQRTLCCRGKKRGRRHEHGRSGSIKGERRRSQEEQDDTGCCKGMHSCLSCACQPATCMHALLEYHAIWKCLLAAKLAFLNKRSLLFACLHFCTGSRWS